SCHRQIESMFELDLLRLRQAERATDIGKRFLSEHDRAGTHRTNLADELNVFDGLRKQLQTAAILFEKTQARAIDLAIDQQTDQTFVTEAGSEREFPLRDIKSRFGVAESLIM